MGQENKQAKLPHRRLPPAVWGLWAFIALLIGSEMPSLPTGIAAGRAFERGRDAKRDTRFDDAIREYTEVIRLIPESERAKAAIAIANFELGNHDVATKQLRELRLEMLDRTTLREIDIVQERIRLQRQAQRRRQ